MMVSTITLYNLAHCIDIGVIFSGAIVKVSGNITLTEGEVRKVCVEIEQTLERTVPLSFAFILDNATSGKYLIIIL